jgi:hypothetical protein
LYAGSSLARPCTRAALSLGGALLSALSCLRISCFYSTSEALYAGQLLVLTAATSWC